MTLSTAQITWLESVSGLALPKESSDQIRMAKGVLETERSLKLNNVKESIRGKLASVEYQKGVFSKVKILDEEGGQMDEFDYSDLKDNRQFKEEYLVQMREAMEQISRVVEEMRDATIEQLNPTTGEMEQVRLYTDEQIAEEVYMPLVRERLMPEFLVPNKWSKTQEMIDASDELYKERLAEYTEQLGDEEETLFAAAKDGTTQLGSITQKVAAMIPGGDADMVQSAIGLVTLGTTTFISVAEVLTKSQLDASVNAIIDNVGSIMSQTISLATGDEKMGALAGSSFSATVAGAKMVVCLAEDPPNVAGMIDEMANGLSATLTLSLGTKSSFAAKTASKVAVQFFKVAASGVRIREHVLNGDSQAIIVELTAVAQGTMKMTQGIVTDSLKEGKSEEDQAKIEKDMEQLTKDLEKGIDLASLGISTGVKITDAIKIKGIKGMAEEIVGNLGDVLTGSLKLANVSCADDIGNAYRLSTKSSLVAYYLTLDPPEKDKAMACLGEGFSAAFSLGNPDKNEKIETVGNALSATFTNMGKSLEIVDAIKDERYGDATKLVTQLGRGITGAVFNKNLQSDASDEDKEDDDETIKSLREGLDEFDESLGISDDAISALNSESAKEALQKQVDELRSAEALSEIESGRDEVERILIQSDESGEKAADSRSIEVLIKEMQRDRMIMEMATKLMSGGAAIVEKFVAPMAIGGAAIKLAANLIKATERAMALNKWINNQKDMAKALSSYETSAANFVKNQGEQFSHYAIQAALELARMIGEIVSCAGISAAAGQALSKGASLALAAEEEAYKFYKKADLANAWRITRKAWDHPESRKLALLARQMNPTLAKYTLAWGATVKRDALAQSAMASCGLNALTLSQRDSNVKQVQKYLETCFNEDNIVLQRYAPPDWMPATIEMTTKSWSTAKSRGEQLGDVEPASSGAIDEWLVTTVSTKSEFLAVAQQIKDVGILQAQSKGLLIELESKKTQYQYGLDQLNAAFFKYQPKTKGGDKPHPEMTALRAEYVLRVREESAEADAVSQEIAKLELKVEKAISERNEYDQAGGDKKYAEIAANYSLPDIKNMDVVSKLKQIKLHRRYQELGGDEEYERVGGTEPLKKMTLEKAISTIEQLGPLKPKN